MKHFLIHTNASLNDKKYLNQQIKIFKYLKQVDIIVNRIIIFNIPANSGQIIVITFHSE